MTPINLRIVIHDDFPRLKIDDHHHVSSATETDLKFLDACFNEIFGEIGIELASVQVSTIPFKGGKWNALVLLELLDKMDRGPLECGATFQYQTIIASDYGLV